MACSLSLSLSVINYHRLFFFFDTRTEPSSSFPSSSSSSSSFVPEHELMVTHKKRHRNRTSVFSNNSNIKQELFPQRSKSVQKKVVSPLSERLRQGKPIQNGSGNSSFRLLRQGKPIQKISFSFRTLATTEQVGREQKTDLFQKPCDNGNRSRQEASLAQFLRQRSNSVQ